MDGSIVLDERRYRVVLGLVGAALVRALKRRHLGQLADDMRLEMTLCQMTPEVTFCLAEVGAHLASDDKGRGITRVRVFDVLISRRGALHRV